jgi:hypothetical protein
MIFGPITGGVSMIIGNFVDFALGKPVVFDFLDFIPDMASAVMAGLVFTGRRKAAIALPLVLVVWYSLDPLSMNLIRFGGLSIPYYWMHLVSVLVLGVALLFEARGKLGRLNPAFIGATVFASTMTGHIAGSIMFENVLGRIDGLPTKAVGAWYFIFLAYPVERVAFTVLWTLVAVPVLRALSRRRRESPRQ